jgi:hypothetical protein
VQQFEYACFDLRGGGGTSFFSRQRAGAVCAGELAKASVFIIWYFLCESVRSTSISFWMLTMP